MKNQMKYFLIAFSIILLSTPLGYVTINIVYYNKNLSGEYVSILNGFIHSFMLVGVLIFSMGLIDMISNKSNKL
jgi:hypothetical protein